jgi:RNase adaptor protein for sRNA GlmZ degradation
MLTVTINSFSYKRALPIDESENGGGFIFDCRAIHNPGRYEEYKTLTGKDQEVISFFENLHEMHDFLRHVFSIIDQSVEKYISRDFTNLMVSFGCTGGQHRSVYSAEKLAEHIYSKYKIDVEIQHIEQDILNGESE